MAGSCSDTDDVLYLLEDARQFVDKPEKDIQNCTSDVLATAAEPDQRGKFVPLPHPFNRYRRHAFS